MTRCQAHEPNWNTLHGRRPGRHALADRPPASRPHADDRHPRRGRGAATSSPPGRSPAPGLYMGATATLMEQRRTLPTARRNGPRQGESAPLPGVGLADGRPANPRRACNGKSDRPRRRSTTDRRRNRPRPTPTVRREPQELCLPGRRPSGPRLCRTGVPHPPAAAGRLEATLGCRLGPTPPSAETAALLKRTFNAVPHPRCRGTSSRRRRRPTTGSRVSPCCNGRRPTGLPAVAGPLIDFSSAQLPDWLWLWEGDLSSLAGFMCKNSSRRPCAATGPASAAGS